MLNRQVDERGLIAGWLIKFLVLLCSVLLLAVAFIVLLSLEKAQGQELPRRGGLIEGQTIIIKYYYNFPTEVKEILSDSIVSVQVFLATVSGGVIGTNEVSATGFVVDDEIVLVTLHDFGEIPSAWFTSSTRIKIYDGANYFDGSLIAINPNVDLALIKVEAAAASEVKFSKKVVTFADDKSNLPDHFYAAKFIPLGPQFYLPIELGQYLMETSIVNGQVLPIMMGIVDGVIEPGFSGSPLIGPDGKIYGVLTRQGGPFTYVVPLEVVKNFIEKGIKLFKGKEEASAKKPVEDSGKL